MSDRILGTIAKALADDEDVTALDYDEARNILAAFEANRIALVELPEPEEREEDEGRSRLAQRGAPPRPRVGRLPRRGSFRLRPRTGGADESRGGA
ncbi:hypothetical protein OPTIMUS_77 [Mycobacterium phage Optimus]|uniref:Uncharacterized protein n=1 Tax=Mycobacterium phage Optimus TaxID=2922218 RepID=G1DAL6_9CAUD|nr:DNA methyltransferase [Mycobacterium phage Optimus]AEJ92288.1 hypothetical protein OPTIMUS_77 [Mycobacterium phage Optimus]